MVGFYVTVLNHLPINLSEKYSTVQIKQSQPFITRTSTCSLLKEFLGDSLKKGRECIAPLIYKIRKTPVN